MRLRVMTEPQEGASYEQLLALCREAERLGFDGFFRSDHYVAIGGGDPSPGPTDAWVTLGALARETSAIRLGTLVTSATFRRPGPLAIAVAQVDAMSGGRVELGLGAGWYEREHDAYGIPFPPLGERFDRLEEQLAVVTGLWSTPPGDTFSHSGPHYTLTDSPALPKPVQSPVPVIVGGHGERRTPSLTARYAAEFNMPFASPDLLRAGIERVAAACAAIDRDPGEVHAGAMLTLCCGADDAEVARRAAAIERDPAELREHSLGGGPAELVERLAAYAAAGADTTYLQVLDLDDLDHLRLVAAEVLPHV